jgi:cytochrome c peroxidase
MGSGRVIANEGIRGAYPWINLDGDDLFITTSVNRHHPTRALHALRAGLSVVGASTNGLVRHIDGGINRDRYGSLRLSVSSFDKSPGKWAPKNLNYLPLSNKPKTMPMFQSNRAKYFEVSFYENLAEHFDFYYEMNESLKVLNPGHPQNPASLDYDFNGVQDTSGYFHEARRVGHGAIFSDEKIGAGANPVDPTANYCQFECDTKDDLYSGKAMYFSGNSYLQTPVVSSLAPGHKILDNANQFTVMFAIKPMTRGQTYSVVKLGRNFQVFLTSINTITVRVNGSATLHNVTTVPINTWSHVAISYNNTSNVAKTFLNGELVNTRTNVTNFLGLANSDVIQIGPVGNAVGTNVYALDQVGLARKVLTSNLITYELSANIQVKRPTSVRLPAGLMVSELRALPEASPSLVRLGERLFFDTRLSSDGRVSCATCHEPSKYFTDGRQLARGAHQRVGTRNTPTLLNMNFADTLFYDGRADTFSDLVKSVMNNSNELNIDLQLVNNYIQTDPNYTRLFGAAQKPRNLNQAFNAISAYVFDKVSGDSKRDLAISDPDIFSAEELLGQELFNGRARCAECHSGSNFSDNLFHNLGFVVSSDEGVGALSAVAKDRFKFKTPSLRNIARTAPYFHNGSAPTLDAVVELYNSAVNLRAGIQPSAVIRPLGLSQAEKAALVAYLQTLTSSQPVAAAFPANEFTFKPNLNFGLLQLNIAAGETRVFGKNNEFKLILQFDGNLVLYRLQVAIWSSQTSGNNCTATTCRVVFQGDGNLVLYKNGRALWHTQTHSNRGHILQILPTSPYVRINNRSGQRVFPN